MRKRDLKKLLDVGLGLAVVSLMLSATGQQAQAETTLEKARAAKTISIGIANAPPWSEMKSDGTIGGAEVDIARAILQKLGIPNVKAIVLDWGAMIPALEASQVDVVTAGMTISPPRCKVVLFSEPQSCGTYAFGVKKGNPLGLKTYKDIATHPTAKVAVCGGCVDERWATEAGVPRERLVVYPDETSALKLLNNGTVDAYSQTTVTILDQLAKNPDPSIDVVHPVTGIPSVCSGTVFRKDDREFRDAWDAALKEMKSNGEFAKIVDTYNFSSQLAKDEDRQKLCQGDN